MAHNACPSGHTQEYCKGHWNNSVREKMIRIYISPKQNAAANLEQDSGSSDVVTKVVLKAVSLV